MDDKSKLISKCKFLLSDDKMYIINRHMNLLNCFGLFHKLGVIQLEDFGSYFVFLIFGYTRESITKLISLIINYNISDQIASPCNYTKPSESLQVSERIENIGNPLIICPRYKT